VLTASLLAARKGCVAGRRAFTYAQDVVWSYDVARFPWNYVSTTGMELQSGAVGPIFYRSFTPGPYAPILGDAAAAPGHMRRREDALATSKF